MENQIIEEIFVLSITQKQNKMKMFLLQHGIYGKGSINPFLVSDSKEVLIDKVKSIIPAEFINEIFSPYDSGNSIKIFLSKSFEYSGFSYNMFSIDIIEGI